MGYYANGFVATRAPDLEGLRAGLPAGTHFVVYRHRSEPVWLLDVWMPDGDGREHVAFHEELPEFAGRSGAASPQVESVIETVEGIFAALGPEATTYGAPWLRRAARIAQAAGTELLFFIADDEYYDMACATDGESIRRVRIELPLAILAAEDGAFVVSPLRAEEFDEEAQALDADDLAALRDIDGVRVGPPPGGDEYTGIYSAIVALWPHGEALVGFGTWDPLMDLDEDFVVEGTGFIAPPPRPWWKVW